MMALSDVLFLHLNPLWYIARGLEQAVLFLWKCFAFIFLLSWWTPTWMIGKAVKWTFVTWANIPFSVPLTFGYIAMKTGAFDVSVIPGMTPELAAMLMSVVG